MYKCHVNLARARAYTSDPRMISGLAGESWIQR